MDEKITNGVITIIAVLMERNLDNECLFGKNYHQEKYSYKLYNDIIEKLSLKNEFVLKNKDVFLNLNPFENEYGKIDYSKLGKKEINLDDSMSYMYNTVEQIYYQPKKRLSKNETYKIKFRYGQRLLKKLISENKEAIKFLEKYKFIRIYKSINEDFIERLCDRFENKS